MLYVCGGKGGGGDVRGMAGVVMLGGLFEEGWKRILMGGYGGICFEGMLMGVVMMKIMDGGLWLGKGRVDGFGWGCGCWMMGGKGFESFIIEEVKVRLGG